MYTSRFEGETALFIVGADLASDHHDVGQTMASPSAKPANPALVKQRTDGDRHFQGAEI